MVCSRSHREGLCTSAYQRSTGDRRRPKRRHAGQSEGKVRTVCVMQRRRAVAIHEAGHAVISRVLGMTCGGASILHNSDEGEEGHSVCADPYLTDWDWQERGKFREFGSILVGRILSHMAGAESERSILRVEPAGDGYDREQITLMAFAAGFQDDWDSWEPRMRRHCGALVKRHRAAIVRVADALERGGTLTDAQIDQLLRAPSV